MPLRRASAYSKMKARPYTRKSAKKSKAYIKTIPQQRIEKFRMGNIKGFENNKFKYVISIISRENVQMRDNAIEAVRRFLHRNFEDTIGDYYLEIKIYPHHIVRENKVYSGSSKGERVNTGMAQSFGSILGRAALISEGKVLFVVGVHSKKNVQEARKIINSVKPKIPCSVRVEVESRE